MYRLIFLFLSLFSLASVANELPTDVSVTVFTTKHYNISHGEVANNIYYLDEVESLEEKTAQLFDQTLTPSMAAQRAKQWLSTDEGKSFELQVRQAYVGVIEGWKMGIVKVPAIVFQERINSEHIDVVYGITDIKQAINLYLEKRGTK